MILTTKTRPHHQRLHCSYFSIPYFLGSLLFSMEKWTKKWTGCSFVFRLKLGSISSAKKNLADEITWITWNYLQNLEIISYPNSYHDFQLRAKCRKIDPATGVSRVYGTYIHKGENKTTTKKSLISYMGLNMYIRVSLLFHIHTTPLSPYLFVCFVLTTTFLFSFPCSTNLIDTYFTVPINVRITLLIYLDPFCMCMFISLTPAFHEYAWVNLCQHFPALPLSCTFIAIGMCTHVSTIL